MGSAAVILLMLQSVGLASLLDAAHKQEVAKRSDEFTDIRTQGNFEEFPFSVHFQPHSGNNTGKDAELSGFYTYEDGTLRYVITIDSDGFTKERLLVFRSVVVKDRSYPGINAYGVRSTVATYRQRLDALAVSNTPFGSFHSPEAKKSYFERVEFYQRLKRPMPKPLSNSYIFEEKLSGTAVRDAVANYQVVVEGVVRGDGQPITGCKSLLHEASIRYPEEVLKQKCWVRSVVSKVALQDRRTGKTLKAWTSSSPTE